MVRTHLNEPVLILEDRICEVPGSSSAGEELWLPVASLPEATGWKLEPEGICRGDVCVPIPAGRAEEWVRDGLFSFSELATELGMPLVHDEPHDVWSIGEAPATRASRLESLEAPDFTLPDLDGNPHSLTDYRGRKVFLVSWASW